MCIFVLIFNNKYTIMTVFIFARFGLNIHHSFLYFVILKGFVFIIGKLFWLRCSDKIVKTNMTKNRAISKKNVIGYFCHIAHPYVYILNITVAERAQHAANRKKNVKLRKQLCQFDTCAANTHNTTKKRNALQIKCFIWLCCEHLQHMLSN